MCVKLKKKNYMQASNMNHVENNVEMIIITISCRSGIVEQKT